MTTDEEHMTHTHSIRLTLCLMLALSLGAYACTPEPPDKAQTDAGEDTISDIEDDDTDQDDAEDTEMDVSACDPACTGDADICDEETGECLECFTEAECEGDDICTNGACAECGVDAHCEGNGGDDVCINTEDGDPDTNVCVACVEEEDDCTDGVCDTGGNDDPEDNVCVGCLDDTHCMDAAASTCDTATDTCVACETDGECAGIAAGEVCDTSEGDGMCVECLVGDEGACSSGQCDPDTSECVQRDTTAGADTCSECSADADCAPYEYCVPMNFAGSAHGNYCLEVFDDQVGCSGPFGIRETKTSMGGVAHDFCTLNEALTTCEALESLEAGDSGQCESGGSPDDSLCGASGVDDGLCRTVGGLINKCTYECDVVSDCPDIRNRDTCGNANNGGTGPDYCGGG